MENPQSSPPEKEEKHVSNRPPNTPFRQQKMKSWQPIMTPLKVVLIFLVIGVAFIPTGVTILHSSNSVFESTVQYDGSGKDVDCSITTQNQGRLCTLSFSFNNDVTGPVYIYYQLNNYYQNHRRYVNSRDPYQLSGQSTTESELQLSCTTLVKNGSLIISPCGLIANSFFTDTFTLMSQQSNPSGLSMSENGIDWSSDKNQFIQPSGFQYKQVQSPTATCNSVNLPTGCKFYNDSGTFYLFYYPDDATTQYLYESYPGLISPIKGVTDEHFHVWMRTGALSTFRKLYGRISHDFKSGDKLYFQVSANYEVDSFSGGKSLVISNLGEFGGKNPYLGIAYIVVGSVSLMFALLFTTKQIINPRAVADPTLLSWT